MNRNKKHRRKHHRAKVATLASFRRIDRELAEKRKATLPPRREQTEAEKIRDAALFSFALEAAKAIFLPMFNRIGKNLNVEIQPSEWPEYLEEKEDVK